MPEFNPDVSLRSPAIARAEQKNVASMVERRILRDFAPACIAVTARGEAVYFSGRTGTYLEAPEGEPTRDVVDMAREGLRPFLRAGIQEAVQSGCESVKRDISVRSGGPPLRLDLIVRPLDESDAGAGLYLVVFQELPRPQEEEPAAVVSAKAIDDAVGHLERELRVTRQNLQSTIEELETSNEELRCANEELQSANEELHASRAEFQALNEELESINVRLTGKIEELDHANSDLQNLMESTQIASMFLDKDLRIRGFTPAIRRLYSLLRSDMGRPITDFGQRFVDASLAEDSRQVLRSLTAVERLIRRAETAEWFRMRVLPYRAVDGVVCGVVITFVDVTEERRAAEALTRMNEDLKQFAYAASHDLQEPLRMVVTFCQLLASEYRERLDEVAREYIQRSVDGALRVERLLRAMRQYWQAVEEPQDPEPADAADALREAIKNLESAVESTGAVITHDPLPQVPCPRSRLVQLFQNLVGNAIKYRGEDRPTVRVSCTRDGADWLFTVSDNGIGIEPRHLTRIFGVFRRLHGNQYPGEGIGLAICSKIVERCGGRIWAESEPGRGSLFKFTLPARAAGRATAPHASDL